ncbi:MAG: hypothetical protein NZM37_06335, partial [Sandaracinaceae bacterium]|nr:hypothetical protein [Sandaracinaceae bacterium]
MSIGLFFGLACGASRAPSAEFEKLMSMERAVASLSGEIQDRAQSALREAQKAHLRGEPQSFELHCQRVEEWLALARMEEENNRLEKEALRLEEEL